MVGFVLIILLIAYVIMSIPAYVIGERRGVEDTWVAFVPFVGPTIVVLWSIDRSGWMILLCLIPIAGWVFSIWLLFAIPKNHDRTLWWAAGLLVPLVGIYAYAFTLPE